MVETDTIKAELIEGRTFEEDRNFVIRLNFGDKEYTIDHDWNLTRKTHKIDEKLEAKVEINDSNGIVNRIRIFLKIYGEGINFIHPATQVIDIEDFDREYLAPYVKRCDELKITSDTSVKVILQYWNRVKIYNYVYFLDAIKFDTYVLVKISYVVGEFNGEACYVTNKFIGGFP